jgi:glycerophosphoryl diester phosphodiesterase
VRWAASIGADYVEFDVRRSADGAFVCRHDPVAGDTWTQLRASGVPGLDEMLEAVAACGLGAHVDLKGEEAGTWAVEVAERCAGRLDPGRVVLTTGNGRAAAALAQWAEARARARPGEGVPAVGLTIGGSTAHLRLPAAVRARIGELYPTRRWLASGAGVLVAHHVLARVRLLRWADRRGVRVLVWTADAPRVVAAALRDRRVWMVTTNYPEAALARRKRLQETFSR